MPSGSNCGSSLTKKAPATSAHIRLGTPLADDWPGVIKESRGCSVVFFMISYISCRIAGWGFGPPPLMVRDNVTSGHKCSWAGRVELNVSLNVGMVALVRSGCAAGEHHPCGR